MSVIYCLMSILIGTLSKKNKKNREKSGLKTGRFAASVYRLFFFAVAPTHKYMRNMALLKQCKHLYKTVCSGIKYGIAIFVGAGKSTGHNTTAIHIGGA